MQQKTAHLSITHPHIKTLPAEREPAIIIILIGA